MMQVVDRLALRSLLLPLAMLGLLATAGCVEDQPEPIEEPMVEPEPQPEPEPMGDRGVPEPAPEPQPEPDPQPEPEPQSCGNEDDLAPNQSADEATPIEVGFTRDDLFICPEAADWYLLPLEQGQTVTVVLVADPPRTDLDLTLIGPDGDSVAESAGETGEEQVELTAAVAGDYRIQVTGYRDQAAFYALTVSGRCGLDAQCPEGQVCDRFEGRCTPLAEPACGDDAFEPNERDGQGAPLELPAAAEGVICDGDRDWFTIEAEDGDSFEVLLGFTPGEDLDLFFIDDSGRIIAQAIENLQTNPERITLSHLPAGTYRLGVVFFLPDGEPDREVDYVLEVIGQSGACEIDRDCRADGLPRCLEGTCQPPEANAPLGAPCGEDEDCGPDADLCWTGGPGGHDNACTLGCQGDGDCAALGAGATCTPVQRGFAVCFPPCAGDDDCGVFYACDAGSCELRGACRVDGDCADGERCTPARTGDTYCAAPVGAPTCGADDLDPNDRFDDATPVELAADPDGARSAQVVDRLICNTDDDWYTFDVPREAGGWLLSVGASFRAGVDIDVYIYDANGNRVAAATSPDMTDEVATARFISPGRYVVRVDQFDSDRLADTAYTLQVLLVDNDDRCTVEGGECARTAPLRMICDEDSGGCTPLEGDGAVALGERCDSDDDCVEAADLCWLFDGGASNICTTACARAADCAEVPGTECTPINQQFAACLPAVE